MTATTPVITRFAPSPTGFLHIGNARTALFNWLYARHCGGKFLLRVEDTDRARSSQAAIDAIFDGLTWLGIDWDAEPVFQYSRRARHREITGHMLEAGKAYRCYLSPEELAGERDAARRDGRRIESPWRDRDTESAPGDIPPVIRFRAPRDGETLVDDQVQGPVRIPNHQLDDMILLRSDGNPTYMLSVVVDDHDSGITHVIRGDDHLINAARQSQLFRALDWSIPVFAHIGLIHGPDGAKLSKRHGALGVDAYRDMGYLPAAIRNYLARLGWSHGDDEVFTTQQAIEWFDIKDIGKPPSRMDFTKLENVNAHYLRNMPVADIIAALGDFSRTGGLLPLDPDAEKRLEITLPELIERVKSLVELYDSARFLSSDFEFTILAADRELLTPDKRVHLAKVREILAIIEPWHEAEITGALNAGLAKAGLKLGQVGPALRVALTGRKAAPGIFVILHALGKSLVLKRLDTIS